jgi:hypothetical protein
MVVSGPALSISQAGLYELVARDFVGGIMKGSFFDKCQNSNYYLLLEWHQLLLIG